MEAIVVIGFLLIPVLGAVVIAAPVLLIAFALNAALSNHQAASKLVHLIAVATICAHFLYSIQGELGRNSEFMWAYVIGASICYFIYRAALNLLNKRPKTNT